MPGDREAPVAFPHAIVRVKLYSTENGGRKKSIPPGRFGCPFVFDGEAFDCRLLLDQTNTTLTPGDTAEIHIKFLYPELVKPHPSQGASFKLWEGGDFADGEVISALI